MSKTRTGSRGTGITRRAQRAALQPIVLEPGQRTFRELTDEALREHALSVQAAEGMVEHAIRSGIALVAAKQQCEEGAWNRWLADYWPAARITASLYMRLARNQDEVRASGATSLLAAKRHLVMIDAPKSPKREGKPAWVKQQALELHAQGLSASEVARRVDVSVSTAHEWINPEKAARYRQRRLLRGAERTAQRRAERERAQSRKINEAARKAGGGIAEAYAQAERFQDIIGRAHRETTDSEARRELALAGEHYRKMRDAIVRALGVA